MRKLLAANSRYLLKNKLFWIELLFTAIFSVWILFANYSPKIQASENTLYLENCFFIMHQIFSVVFAAAISLIAGTEYSDGTIRNKLVSGHTRGSVYFSILLTNIMASIAVIAVHGIVSYGIGYFLFGAFHIPAAQVLTILLCAALANLVFAALFITIALNCSNKSLTAVICLLSSLQEKEIQPQITLPEHPVWLHLDNDAVNRIFSNIISNALKYSEGDFSVIMDSNACITFSNKAPNLDSVVVGRLFDRFYTIEANRNATGLGLSIARILTERMGGTIEAGYAEGRLDIRLRFTN